MRAMNTFSLAIQCLFQILLLVQCKFSQEENLEYSSKNFETSNNLPVKEKALEQVSSGGIISFVYPQNNTRYYPSQKVEFFLSSTGASDFKVTVGIDCGGIFSSSTTGYVSDPFLVRVFSPPSAVCTAYIIPPPEYTSTNLTLLIEDTYCNQYYSSGPQEFNETSPASFSVFNPVRGTMAKFTITNFTGVAEPLQGMVASIERRGVNKTFYQSSCNDSNGAYNFNMNFMNYAPQKLTNCSIYNSDPSYTFDPYQIMFVGGDHVVGEYKIQVNANSNLTYGRLDSIGMEICLTSTFWMIEVQSLYINPGQVMVYDVSLFNWIFDVMAVNVTLSCSSGNQTQSFFVTKPSIEEEGVYPYSFTIPSDASGNCTLSAESAEGLSAVYSSELILVLTTDTVLSIARPLEGRPIPLGAPFLVTISSSNTSNPTNVNATLNCTLGELYTASGDTQNGIYMAPDLNTYGVCNLQLEPIPGYISLSNVEFFIFRQTTLVTPVAEQSLIANQPFDVLITAYGGLQNSTVGIVLGCTSGHIYEFNGTLGIMYSPILNASAYGVCILRANVFDGFTFPVVDLILYAYNPLISIQGLPNPATGGQVYSIQINSTDGNDYDLTATLNCPSMSYSMSAQTNTAFSFTIPSNLNGIGCTFTASLDDTFEYSSFFTPTQYALDVSMSPQDKSDTIQRLGIGNFFSGSNVNTNDQTNQQKRLKRKFLSVKRRKSFRQ